MHHLATAGTGGIAYHLGNGVGVVVQRPVGAAVFEVAVDNQVVCRIYQRRQGQYRAQHQCRQQHCQDFAKLLHGCLPPFLLVCLSTRDKPPHIQFTALRKGNEETKRNDKRTKRNVLVDTHLFLCYDKHKE